jgi:hypothetical protein
MRRSILPWVAALGLGFVLAVVAVQFASLGMYRGPGPAPDGLAVLRAAVLSWPTIAAVILTGAAYWLVDREVRR